MGKFVQYLSLLVFIDILFFITGQMEVVSTKSVILDAILNPSLITTTTFFSVFLGLRGIRALTAQSGVTSGVLVNATNVLAFTAMAVNLGKLVGDFTNIFNTLKDYNVVLATVIMSPVIILFVVAVSEWLRGKD